MEDWPTGGMGHQERNSGSVAGETKIGAVAARAILALAAIKWPLGSGSMSETRWYIQSVCLKRSRTAESALMTKEPPEYSAGRSTPKSPLEHGRKGSLAESYNTFIITPKYIKEPS